jgi:hypothetical protein
MRTQHLTLLAVSITAILVVGSIGLQYMQISAEEKEEKFKMVEGITITGVFTFRDGTELVDIQLFDQLAGFGETSKKSQSDDDGNIASELTGRAKPTIFIEKIAGNTPLLYEAADQSWKFRSRSTALEYPYKFFELEMIIAQGGNVLRTFNYKDCTIVDYAVKTLMDKEEGYTGKGIAVVDQYKLECDGYKPMNPQYEQIMYNGVKADTISTLDLKQPYSTWSDNYKYSNQKP